MANTIPPVLIELQLETAKISAQMAQMKGDFDNFGQTVTKQNSFMEKFKANAAGMFAGNLMAQGFNIASNAIRGAVVDAQEYELKIAQLNAGIKSTGNVAGLSVEGLKAQASALEKLTSVDENLIMQSQAVFQTFTNVRNVVGEGNDIFNQASVAALDLSTKMGGDLQGATVQLGKALNDPIKGISALTRVGVVFTDAQKAQIKALVQSGDVMGAQKIILAEMKTEFGGAAEAAGDTFAGAVFRAKDKVQDFTRDLVTNLQPILLSIGKIIGDLYSKYLAPLFSWIGKNKEAVGTFVAILGTAYAMFKTYSFIMGVVTAATELYTLATVLMAGGKMADVIATGQATRAQLMLNAAMTANPIGLIIAAIALVAAGFVYAWNHSETFRKVIITIAKGVVTYIAFMIRAWGQMIEIILKVVTGPLRMWLTVMSKLPGVGKYAKQGLDFINNGIEKVGDFAEMAASKVEGFKDNLDGLANKKISIPGFGGAKKDDKGGGGGADAPGGGGAKGMTDAQKKKLQGLKEDAQKIYGKMNDVIKEATDKRAKIEQDYAEKKGKLVADELKAEAKLREDNAKKITELETKAAQDRAAIVKKGQDMLRSAFEQGTKFDLSKTFEDSDKSGAGLLQKMKDKFAAVKKLQQQAGALASAGYSQTFIQDVVSQGPEMGGAMAEALLNSTPETQGQLKELYAGLQDASKHGLDTLAAQMSTSTSFATEELLAEYEKIGIDLADALDKNQTEFNEKIKDLQAELQDALLEAQNSYNEAIDELTKDTIEKLAKLQDEIKATAKEMLALGATKAAIAAMANSPAAPILAGVAPIKPIDSGGAGVMAVYNYNTKITGVNLADPNAAATATANAISFGTPQGIRVSTTNRFALGTD